MAYDKIIVGSVGSSAKHFQTAIELLPRIDMTAFKSKLLPLAEFKQAWELSASHAHLKVILDAS